MKRAIALSLVCFFVLTSCEETNPSNKNLLSMSIDELNAYSQEISDLEDNDEITENSSIRIMSDKIVLDVLLNRRNVILANVNFQDKNFKKLLEKRYKELYKDLPKTKQVYFNPNFSPAKFNENKPTSSRVTKAEADEFMRNRMYQINQTLMNTKVTDFNGSTLYYYLSVAENGMTCISAVSELKLEVLAADCGETYRKIEEWNAIR